MTETITGLELVTEKKEFSQNDIITINVKFSLDGEIRNSFTEKNWTDAWEKNDNQFKLKYGIKLVSGGLRKHELGKSVDSYRKASIFWTRNPKLVNPMKERKIWVQVAKNFEPYIGLTEEEVRHEFLDFDEPITFNASELGTGEHKISADVFASWQKHSFIEKNEQKTSSDELRLRIS